MADDLPQELMKMLQRASTGAVRHSEARLRMHEQGLPGAGRERRT